MVITGSVPESVLQEAWKSIYLDYSDVLISESEQAMVMIERKVRVLELRIAKAHAIKTYLTFIWSEQFETELIKLGVVDSRYPEGAAAQESWWKRAVGRIKRWEVELESEQKRLLQMHQSLTGASEKVTREVFQDFIVQIEKHVKYSIKEAETTVARFVAMVKDYQRHIAALSKANKNNHARRRPD